MGTVASRASDRSSGDSQRNEGHHTQITVPHRTSMRQEALRFDPIREICRNRHLATEEPYVCVFTHGEYACTTVIRTARKTEAMQLAVKMQNQAAKEVTWADLWKFVTDVHCVHHFDEAVNFELPYSLEILTVMLQEQALHEEKQRRFEEWEDELRRGEAAEDARRCA